MPRNEAITSIRRRYPNQWLIIRVARMDEATTTPLTGRLLAHSADRDEIYRKSIGQKGAVYIAHSSPRIPHGYAVAF